MYFCHILFPLPTPPICSHFFIHPNLCYFSKKAKATETTKTEKLKQTTNQQQKINKKKL